MEDIQPEAAEVRLLQPTLNVSKPDNLDYCLKNFCACDIAPLDPSQSMSDVARDNLQLLVNKLVELPRSSSDGGTLITLPKNHAFRLPRALPVPRASSAPKTRWEKFAQEKGIVKRKRSRKVWDETIQDWAPRYGAYSIKKNQEKAQAIVEMKPGDDPEEDPFEKISREKASPRQNKNTGRCATKWRALQSKNWVPLGCKSSCEGRNRQQDLWALMIQKLLGRNLFQNQIKERCELCLWIVNWRTRRAL
eukprot:Selendium_serpulae@DN6357_c0_g3_i6.p1